MRSVGCVFLLIMLFTALVEAPGNTTRSMTVYITHARSLPRKNKLQTTIQSYREGECNGGVVTKNYIKNEIIKKKCTRVLGSLIIKDIRARRKMFDAFRSILHIDGSLQIKNTETLGSLDFFSQLQSIGNWELREPALQIVNNTGLISFDCESLVSLASSNRIVVVMEDNPDLTSFTENWMQLILHPLYLDIDEEEIQMLGDSLIYISRTLAMSCVLVLFLITVLVVITSILRRLYNHHVLKLISQSLTISEEIELDEQQKGRLQKYVNEVFSLSISDWKHYCDSVINHPHKDPTYHRKPKKTPDMRKAEAQLRKMNIKMKLKRGKPKLAKLPEQRTALKDPVAEKKAHINLSEDQEDAFEIWTRNDDEDHNLAWSGDLMSAYHKVFIGDDQGKILRREIPTTSGETRTLKRHDDVELHIEGKDAFIVTTNVLEFQLLIKKKFRSHNSNLITQTFTTRPILYNGWPEDGFPKDLKTLQKFLLSISSDTKIPTIVIGKSTDASCELFWMLNLVVKSVVGRATSARLSSILEACIILLSPGFLTSHHFLYLLKFVLSWASSVGAMTDEQRGLIPDWRTGYNAEELKCEPRLYGKYYLRVINLDIIDRLCDEILVGLDATNPPSKSDFKDNQHNVLLKDYQNEMDTQLETGELREEGGRNLRNSKPSEPVKTSETPPTKENKELNTAPNSPAIKKKKPHDNTKSPQKIRPTMGLSYAANALHLALTPRFHRAAKERSQSVSQSERMFKTPTTTPLRSDP